MLTLLLFTVSHASDSHRCVGQSLETQQAVAIEAYSTGILALEELQALIISTNDSRLAQTAAICEMLRSSDDPNYLEKFYIGLNEQLQRETDQHLAEIAHQRAAMVTAHHANLLSIAGQHRSQAASSSSAQTNVPGRYRLPLGDDAKECPHCGQYAMKDEHCNFVVCGRDEHKRFQIGAGCGKPWCYQCGKKLCGQMYAKTTGVALNLDERHDHHSPATIAACSGTDYCPGGHNSHKRGPVATASRSSGSSTRPTTTPASGSSPAVQPTPAPAGGQHQPEGCPEWATPCTDGASCRQRANVQHNMHFWHA